jgi:phospholipid/cholesterol/gamma-HCH transport system substrate-binding protein
MKKNHKVAWMGVLLGLLALVVVALFGYRGGWLFPTRTYSIQVLFDQGAEIPAGSRVTVGGIPVGRVRGVNFADPDSLLGGVIAELAVRSDHKLRRGTRARVMENSGSGGPRLEILPGPRNEALLESGDMIKGEVFSSTSALLSPELSSTMEKSITQMGDAADTLRTVLADFHVLFQPTAPVAVDRIGGPAGNLASAALRLDAALSSVNAVLGDATTQTELKETLHNLHAISEDGKEFVASAREAFVRVRVFVEDSEKLVVRSHEVVTRVDQNIDSLMQNVNRTLDLAANLLREINVLAAKVGRGEGSLGKLIQDDKLHEAMLLTLRRLAAEKQ